MTIKKKIENSTLKETNEIRLTSASLAQWAARQSHNPTQKSEGREFDPHTRHLFYISQQISFFPLLRSHKILAFIFS